MTKHRQDETHDDYAAAVARISPRVRVVVPTGRFDAGWAIQIKGPGLKSRWTSTATHLRTRSDIAEQLPRRLPASLIRNEGIAQGGISRELGGLPDVFSSEYRATILEAL